MVTTTLRSSVIVALLASAPALAAGAADFDRVFRDRTMRLDYFHTSDHGREIVALDRIVDDGPWAGSRTRLLDELNLGAYLFTVHDLETNRAIYSRGFASIFGEWDTVPDSKSTARTFHESLRFPWPLAPVRIVLERRDEENHWRPVWSTTVDPDSRFVNPAPLAPPGTTWAVMENGPPAEKVDLLILGDGYTAEEMEDFHADATRLAEFLFTYEPFASRRDDFNVWAIDLPSATSGVSRPRADDFHRTPLSTEFNSFDSERYVLTMDNRAFRDIASGAPYEFVEILVNEAQYGGGGIFANQATASVDGGYAEYVFVHEFGHHFAGLADEYYTSSVAYETGRADLPEPWEPNITALHDPSDLKWGDLVAEGVPVPTPWEKAAYDEKLIAVQKERAELRRRRVPEAEMNAFFDREKAFSTDYLASQEHAGEVGAFEGAGYEVTGLYRPQTDCVMFTRDEVDFCRVCQRAIERVIDLYSRP